MKWLSSSLGFRFDDIIGIAVNAEFTMLMHPPSLIIRFDEYLVF